MKRLLLLFLIQLGWAQYSCAQDDENLQNIWELEQYNNYQEFYQGSELEDFDEPAYVAEVHVEDTTKYQKALKVDTTVIIIDPKSQIDSALMVTRDPDGVTSEESDAEKLRTQSRIKPTISSKRRIISQIPAPKSFLKRALSGPTRNRYAGRLEIRELNLKDVLERKAFFNSRGTLGMILASRLNSDDGETYFVDGNSKMGELYGLCEDEPYWSQPSACFCTAFLVDSVTVATAGHCIQHIPLEDIRLILGFESARVDGEMDLEIASRDVFGIQEVVEATTGQELDFVLLTLDHPANAQKILKIAKTAPERGDSIYAIGFPSGLPMKVAGVGTVNSENNGTFFYSDLETYQGNSGSPIFNAKTHEVVGLIIEGDQDFEMVGNCRRTKQCFGRNCRGEKAIAIIQLNPYFLQRPRY